MTNTRKPMGQTANQKSMQEIAVFQTAGFSMEKGPALRQSDKRRLS
jgi:hypothetical protein